MWYLMSFCYLLSAVNWTLLAITGLQGYLQFMIVKANHPAFAILTIISFLFTQTLLIFFFVGTGINVKDFSIENKLSANFYERTRQIKKKLFPHLTSNILVIGTVFAIGGGVATEAIPAWVHGLLFWFGFAQFSFVLKKLHWAFKENTAVIVEMSREAVPA